MGVAATVGSTSAEIHMGAEEVATRDSKFLNGGVLVTTRETWLDLIAQIRRGDLGGSGLR